jgi:hypothetical protein
MQRLLATSALSAAAPRSDASAVQTGHDEPDSPSESESVAESATPSDTAAARAGRRLDREELAEMRANIDSMRQIANLSARSAVAQHFAGKLAVAFRVKQTLTVVAAMLSGFLLSAELWTKANYRLPGLCSLVVTFICGIELLRTIIQMRRVRQIAAMKSDDGDPAMESKTPVAESATK